jgi:hypothetical protein
MRFSRALPGFKPARRDGAAQGSARADLRRSCSRSWCARSCARADRDRDARRRVPDRRLTLSAGSAGLPPTSALATLPAARAGYALCFGCAAPTAVGFALWSARTPTGGGPARSSACSSARTLARPGRSVRRPDVRPPFARRPWSCSSIVSRETSLLKWLISPPAVRSCTINARFDSSNLPNQSSQSIRSSLPSPEYPGKSMRIIPMSPSPLLVRFTAAGQPPRRSTQLRISS